MDFDDLATNINAMAKVLAIGFAVGSVFGFIGGCTAAILI